MFSSGLKYLFDNAVLPAALTAAGIAFPPLAVLLSIPVIGTWVRKVIQWFFDYFIDKGIVELKVTLIEELSQKAQRDYAPQIALLREAQAQESLTPEQEKEYADRLNDLVRSRPDITRG